MLDGASRLFFDEWMNWIRSIQKVGRASTRARTSARVGASIDRARGHGGGTHRNGERARWNTRAQGTQEGRPWALDTGPIAPAPVSLRVPRPLPDMHRCIGPPSGVRRGLLRPQGSCQSDAAFVIREPPASAWCRRRRLRRLLLPAARLGLRGKRTRRQHHGVHAPGPVSLPVWVWDRPMYVRPPIHNPE